MADTADGKRGPPAATELLAGSLIGRYLILGTLGSGGMGVVYAAFDPELDRKIALKLLKGFSDLRLLKEAQAMARLAHPNVVAIHDVGDHEGRIFIAMEYVEGHTVRQWLAESPREWKDVLAVFREAGKGLVAAHAAGLTHRDFKPDNVMVGFDGRVRVTDFGLASAHPAPAALLPFGSQAAIPHELGRQGDHTVDDNVVGSLQYMAPELLRGRAADARSDQFAFGISLYEALYGAKPYAPEEVRNGELPPAPPGSRVPSWVRRVVAKCLAPRPEERFESLENVLEALSGPVSGRSWRTYVMPAAVAAAVMLVAGVAYEIERRSVGVCHMAPEEFEGAWGAGREALTRQAFVSSDAPFAEETFTRVKAQLDAYARQWAEARYDVCAATRIRQEQSHELMSLRLECLDRRKMELAALTDVFTRADAQIVAKSVKATGELPDVSVCTAVVTRRNGAGEGTTQGAEATRRIIRARALFATGKADEALAVAEEEIGRARSLRSGALEADALYLKGLVLVWRGDPSAVSILTSSFHRALAAGADETAFEAALSLARFEANVRHPEETERWVGLAEAELERLERPVELEVKLSWMRSIALTNARKQDEALRVAGDALALLENRGDGDSLMAANILNSMANGLKLQGKMTEALDTYARSLKIREKQLGHFHIDTGIVLLNIGAAQTDIGSAAKGLATQTEAKAVFEATIGTNGFLYATSLLNIAEAQMWLGRTGEARASGKAALESMERALGPSELSVAAVLMVLGENALRAQAPQEAFDYLRRAVAIHEQRFPRDKEYPVALAGLGLAQLQRTRREALPTLEKARALCVGGADAEFEGAFTRFALAQGLWRQRADATRAKTLAVQAKGIYERLGLPLRAKLVEEWLKGSAQLSAQGISGDDL